MGIEALYRLPKTTKPHPGHMVYPYLLRNLEVTRPNQVWAMDITDGSGICLSHRSAGLVFPAGIGLEVIHNAGCSLLSGGR